MTQTTTDHDLDDFIRWIKAQEPPSAVPITSPSPALLSMAWETVQAHQSAKIQRTPHGNRTGGIAPLFRDCFRLMAAADGADLRDTPILGEGGEWTIEVLRWVERPEEGYVLCKLLDPTPEKLAQVEGLTGALGLSDGTELTQTIHRGRVRFEIRFAALAGQREATFNVRGKET